jgi:hypothetical protein
MGRNKKQSKQVETNKICEENNNFVPYNILEELKKDNIAFSNHIYREKYASEEEEGDDWTQPVNPQTKEEIELRRKELELQERLIRLKEEELKKESSSYEETLLELINKHEGNEEKALQERLKLLKDQGHDDEKIKEIIAKEAQDIDKNRKSDRDWQEKQSKKEAEENRKQEIANMAAHQRAFAHVGDAYNKYLGKYVNWAGDKIGLTFGWLMVVFIIFLIIFGSTFAIYKTHENSCSDLRETSGWGNFLSIWVPVGQSEFARCIQTKFWSSVGNFFKNLNFIAPLTRIFNEQVNIATGGLYYAQVDKNAREPTGLFIKDIDVQARYYTDEAITIAATIEIKTINSKINGIVQGFLDNYIACHQIYPTTGGFNIDQYTSERFLCTFEPDTLSKTGDVSFTITSDFGSKNIAYLRPMIIKRTSWDKYTPEQKSKAKSLSESNSLKDSNSPMRIGGKIGNDGNIVLINDYSDTSSSTFPFSLSLQSGERNDGWTNGKVRRINKLFIVLPFGVELNPDLISNEQSKEFTACRGYTFEKLNSCNEIKQHIDDDSYSEFLCEENENIYLLKQGNQNTNIASFDDHTTIHCILKTDNEKLFTNSDGENIARVENKGIKIYSDFQYNVERILKLNVIRRFQDSKRGFVVQSCSDEIKKDLSKNKHEEITIQTKDNYGSKYQTTFNKVISLDTEITQKERVVYEALMTSITEKYSNFAPNKIIFSSNINYNNNMDYPVPTSGTTHREGYFLTGCLLIGQQNVVDNIEKDIGCLVPKLKKLMQQHNNDIDKVLSGYYTEATTKITGETQEVYSQKALKSDYNKWLYNLCDKSTWKETKDETYQSSTPTAQQT